MTAINKETGVNRVRVFLTLCIFIFFLNGCSKINRFISINFCDGGTGIVLFAESHDETGAELDRVVDIIKRRLKNYGIGARGRSIWRDENTIFVTLPFTKYDQTLVNILGINPDFSLRLVSSDIELVEKAGDGDIPSGYDLLEDGTGKTFLVNKDVLLTGADIDRAKAGTDYYGNPAIMVSFNNAAARKLHEITKNNIGKKLAIIINGEIVMAPEIIEEVPGGDIQITGSFSIQEVKEAVALLNSSVYPVSVRIDSAGKAFVSEE